MGDYIMKFNKDLRMFFIDPPFEQAQINAQSVKTIQTNEWGNILEKMAAALEALKKDNMELRIQMALAEKKREEEAKKYRALEEELRKKEARQKKEYADKMAEATQAMKEMHGLKLHGLKVSDVKAMESYKTELQD